MTQTRESRPSAAQPNIQDVFLNYARREKLAVYIRLMDGSDFEGRVKNFDRFAVIVAKCEQSRRPYLIKYERMRTGVDTSEVHWHEAFACWRTCVILQQLHQRYVRGESTDERMASRGDHIGMLSQRAARILADHRDS